MLAGILCNLRASPTRRYGPALTPAERARWFGLSFESPVARRKRRALCERLKRESCGIIEPEKIEALIEEKIEPARETVRQALAPQQKLDDRVLIDQIIGEIALQIRRDIRQIEIEQEAAEAAAIARQIFDEADQESARDVDAIESALQRLESVALADTTQEPASTVAADGIARVKSEIAARQDRAYDSRLDTIVDAIAMMAAHLSELKPAAPEKSGLIKGPSGRIYEFEFEDE